MIIYQKILQKYSTLYFTSVYIAQKSAAIGTV